jgi:general secretion pathway protein N
MSSRRSVWLVAGLLLAMLAFFPLRHALTIAGVARLGLSAAQIEGTIWHGRIVGLRLGEAELGDVGVRFLPLQLLLGRAHIALLRESAHAAPLRASVVVGFNRREIKAMNGTMMLGARLVPLPVDSLEFVDAHARFSGSGCAEAGGFARARVSLPAPFPPLDEGLVGTLRCDGAAVLLPLAGRSGMERLSLRFWPDGRASAQMLLRVDGSMDGAPLLRLGFVRAGQDYVLTLEQAP